MGHHSNLNLSAMGVPEAEQEGVLLWINDICGPVCKAEMGF